jgi:predicted  nucleic acid-binding Zn-ribbon protein
MRACIFAVAVLLVATNVAKAQDASVDAQLRDVVRKMTVDLHAARDNQAALQAQLDQMQKQRDALQLQVTELNAKQAQQPAAPPPAQQAKSDADGRQLRDTIDALKKQNAALQAGLTHWQSAYQDAATIARTKDAESRQLGATSKSATEKLGICEAKNTKLIGVANEILHLYRSQDFKSVLLGSYEPLLGYKQVELENIVQDNEDKIRAQRYYPNERPAAPAGTAPAAARPVAAHEPSR